MCVAPEEGEWQRCQWHSPPVAHLNLAFVTPAVGRAAPLVNKCPLVSPELLQAARCSHSHPAALLFSVFLITFWEIWSLHRCPRGLLSIVPPTIPLPGHRRDQKGLISD